MESFVAKQPMADESRPTEKLFTGLAVNHVNPSAIKEWLSAGWQDIWKTPAASLSYGIIFALVGIVLTLIFRSNPVFVITLSTGFLLVGSFIAVGLYDLSRRIEHGQPPTFMHSLSVISHNVFGLGIYAVALSFVMLSWVRITTVFAGLMATSTTVTGDGYGHLFTSLLTMDNGWLFILGFIGVGLLFASIAFTTGVVTVPLLLHRKIDIMTASVTSIRVVKQNPKTMLLWAMTIVAIIGLGIATFYIGLIIAMPLVAHASWHAYRDLVKD
ncbi:DUF2189 domain-containing protein [Thiothrix subterranea]|uniref:DUF2189 domain-containing protein n=1 Tax=Thiothrix subterranea TaxID=2735563 RepID=UPI00192BED9B|nr:DUF2189 domain-containing protein [Thiothrix subterranea]QQZ27324.1 DUF2189 domain-containing protein [Thiothrix subterranea]